MRYACHANKAFRSQSAMEYLMTYGWAILIIAVVLGTLFQLGVFNSANLAPRAQAGNCRVFRAAGEANLEGVCKGELPQSVAQFNGANSYVNVGSASNLALSVSQPFTISAWILRGRSLAAENIVGEYNGVTGYLLAFVSVGNNQISLYLRGSSSQLFTTSLTEITPSSGWTFVTVTWDGSSIEKVYINGAGNTGTPSGTVPSSIATSAPFTIGQGSGSYFEGNLADIQVYNTTLDANQIQALYLEGIGGAPVAPQSVVGWWPLNGDVNDYSGNNNNGAATNVIYTSAWTNGYTTP